MSKDHSRERGKMNPGDRGDPTSPSSGALPSETPETDAFAKDVIAEYMAGGVVLDALTKVLARARSLERRLAQAVAENADLEAQHNGRDYTEAGLRQRIKELESSRPAPMTAAQGWVSVKPESLDRERRVHCVFPASAYDTVYAWAYDENGDETTLYGFKLPPLPNPPEGK